MIKKFLIVGDNHLDSSRPVSRIDNYMESGLMELQETLQIAEAAKCDYYILLGDVFNKIDVGAECRNRAVELLVSNEGKPWSFEKYLVVGNHDVAQDPDKLEKSTVKTLISAGAVKHVNTIPDLPVRFFDFGPFLDKQLNEGLLLNYDEKILFLHASITDKPLIFDHVLFQTLPINPNTKLIFSGHIHRKMSILNENGVHFMNPGSVGRPEMSQDYEKSKVSVLLLKYDFDTDEYKTKEVNLKYSLPYDVVFDIEKMGKIKQESQDTEKFIQAVTDETILTEFSSNISEDLKKFAKERKVSDKVANKAVEVLDIVKTGGTL